MLYYMETKNLPKESLWTASSVILRNLEMESYGFNCVEDIISKYEPAFKQLGMEIPDNLKAIKSYADIKNIIKIEN